MDLEQLQRNWDELGKATPFESVLCPPVFGQKWDMASFFATGEREVEALIEHLCTLGRTLPKGTALDFGCGIGRVTQPLSRHFNMCYGIDIAPSLLKLARQYNKHGERCRYVLNESERLEAFADSSVNFVYSMITLQNIAPRYAAEYIAEFVRVLAPGGLLVFQIPGKPAALRTMVKQMLPDLLLNLFYRVKYRGRPRLEMHGIDRKRVIQIVASNGGTVLDAQPYRRTSIGWSSYRYCVTK